MKENKQKIKRDGLKEKTEKELGRKLNLKEDIFLSVIETLAKELKPKYKNELQDNLKLAVWDYNEEEDVLEQLEDERNHLLKILEQDKKADARNSYWATHSLILTNQRITKLCMIAKKQGYELGVKETQAKMQKKFEDAVEIVVMKLESRLDEFFDKEIQRQEARSFIKEFVKELLNEVKDGGN